MPIASYDPFDPQIIAEPYPYYAFLRESAPCYHVADRGIWVLSRYDDVRAALANTSVFSSTEGVGFERRPVPMMIAYDPPQHTRLRRIVAGRFTPRALAQWSARIESISAELLEPLLDGGALDLVAELATPLPLQVIAEMMGIPIERCGDFKRWSDATILALSGAVDLSTAERQQVEMMVGECAMYFDQVIRERSAGGDDLISLLMRPNEEGEQLVPMEIISFCILLLVAGNETTTNLISNAIHHFAEHPDDWQRLAAEPGLLRQAIEESLRHQAPIQGFFRTTREPVEVAGTTIPAQEKVMLLYASANRDPRKYTDPDSYHLERNPADHLAFGLGPHTCLGAQLARMEARALFELALPRIQRFELAGDAQRTTNALLRGYQSLPVRSVPR